MYLSKSSSQAILHTPKASLRCARFAQAIATLLLVGGCAEQHADGLSEDIHKLVPAGLLKEIEENGQVIHRGVTPPNIEGTFDGDPMTLQRSNFVDNFPVGHVFTEQYFTFSNQDAAALTVELSYVQGPETGEGLASFLSGDGSGFTLFTKVSGNSKGYPFDSITVLSGELEPKGIRDLQLSLFMLDAHGAPATMVIQPGQGRVIVDSDRFSPRE